METKKEVKRFWKWLWHSESIWSYIVFLILVFILVKFILLPGLGLVFGTTLPMAIVESSSMEHYSLHYCTAYNSVTGECLKKSQDYEICGKTFSKFQSFNLEEYWQECGKWYEDKNITQEQFSNFPLKKGFRKGDLVIIFGKRDISLGDVIIFDSGKGTPIIHRVISLNPLETKGDHNSGQLIPGNNLNNINEIGIKQEQVIGTAVFRIPYIGWVKLFFVEMFRKVF